MVELKMRNGLLLVTADGKLATSCSPVCTEVSGGADPVGDGELVSMLWTKGTESDLAFAEFPNFPEFLWVQGTVDDFCIIAPAAPTGGSFSMSAAAGFAVAPNYGYINYSGCCTGNSPYSFSVSVGGATYSAPSDKCQQDGDGLSLEDLQDGLEGAGIFVARKLVYEDGSLQYDDCLGVSTVNHIITKAQLQSMGFTDAKLKLYGAVLGCGAGSAGLSFTGCPYVKWAAVWDCKELEWKCKKPIGVTEEKPGEWTTVDGIYFTKVQNSLAAPADPDPYTCRRKAIATYHCFEADPDLRWTVGWSAEAGPALPLYGWSMFNNNNPDLGYVDGGRFECVVENEWDDNDNPTWELPDPPTTPPNCYCRWYAYYDCNSQSWSIYLDSCYATHIDDEHENQWVGTGGYRTMVSTSNTQPSPPSAPTCVAYWEAVWNGTGWDKYTDFTNVGEVTGWTCSGAEYASGAFAVGITPDDPDCQDL